MVKGARPSVRDRLVTPPFVVASVAHFLHALAYYLFLSLPGFLRALGASEVTIGALVGAAAAAAIVGRPPLGRVMDTRGRKVVMLAGGALATAVCASYLLVDRLGPLLVGLRLLHGMAEAMLFASLFAFAADLVPESRRIEGIALFGVSGLIPMALGGLVADWVLRGGDYSRLFVMSAACSGVALVLTAVLRDVPPAEGHLPPRGVMSSVRQADLVPLWIVGLAFATALAGPVTFMKTFVMETGAGSVGGFFAAYGLAAATVRVVGSSLPDRVGPKRVLFPSLVTFMIGLAILAFVRVEGGAAVVLGGLFCGTGHGFAFPILLGLVIARARPAERGAALSIFTALFDGGMLVGGPLLGLVIRLAGYPAMYATGLGIALVGVAVFARADRGR